MPFARPSLGDLVGRIRADIRSRLSLAGPLLRRAMADVFAAVWAGAVHLLYGYLDWLSHQISPLTSDDEVLLSQAAMYGITPTAASFAGGIAAATGVNGSVIPIDTILTLDGIEYHTTSAETIASGTAALPVSAVLAGSSGDAAAGVELSFETPISGVSATAIVDADGLTGGFDQETVDDVRDQLILRLQEPPEGGADHDYEQWALAVAGVTRAWVYPIENGLGTVVVRFVDDADPVSIFPGSPQVAAVQAALDAQRPITAEVTAVAPTALTVAFTIAVLPNTSAVQAAVAAELADLLAREAEPGDIATTRGIIKHSHITTAIGVAEGVEDFTLTVPAGDITPALGELAIMGAITWV